MFSQTYTKTKSSIKYPIRKLYAFLLRAKTIEGLTITPYEYIEDAIEIQWTSGESFFAGKNGIRVWVEDGKLEILDIS